MKKSSLDEGVELYKQYGDKKRWKTIFFKLGTNGKLKPVRK